MTDETNDLIKYQAEQIGHIATELGERSKLIIKYTGGDPPTPDPGPDPEPTPDPVYDWEVPWRFDNSTEVGCKNGIGLVKIGPKKAPVSFPAETSRTRLRNQLTIKSWEWFRWMEEAGGKNYSRDRFIFDPGQIVAVYLGGSNYHKPNGKYSYPGPGGAQKGNNAWELVPNQFCRWNKKWLFDSLNLFDRMRLDDTPNYAVQPLRIFLMTRLCETKVPEPVRNLRTLDGKINWYWNGSGHGPDYS